MDPHAELVLRKARLFLVSLAERKKWFDDNRRLFYAMWRGDQDQYVGSHCPICGDTFVHHLMRLNSTYDEGFLCKGETMEQAVESERLRRELAE